MSVSFDFENEVVLVTGATGVLGNATVDAFTDAGATVCGTSTSEPEAFQGAGFYQGDLTAESDVERVVADVVDDHGRLDCVLNIVGMWKGGTPTEDTDIGTFDAVMNVNLKTMFLTCKHALPHLQETEGAIVSVSAKSSLEGGAGDGPYRASKAGVRLLTESIAEENSGVVRANAIMPNVIDTPANREMMPDADHDNWADPADIAEVILFLCSDASDVTSGAAVPVYGEP